MKKLFFYPIFVLLINVSCEDPLEGNIVPYNTNTDDFEAILPPEPEDYTHWLFVVSIDEIKDSPHHVGTNPDTGSEIYIQMNGEIVIDAWATQPRKFTTRVATSQSSQDFGFINPNGPVAGQPSEAVLVKFSICFEDFCSSQTIEGECIKIVQPNSKNSCNTTQGGIGSKNPLPDSAKAHIYVPKEL